MKLSNFWRYWLPLLALSLFLLRCLYEWDPLRFAFLGDGLFVAPLALVVLLLARWLFNPARRLDPERLPPDLSPLLLLFVYVVWPPVDLLWALMLALGAAALFGAHYLLPQRARWFDLAVALIVLAIYLITLGDHVGQADTFEFQVVAPQLGIAHPTGYSLFIIIGKLFSLLPIGSLAWRVNLTSAIFAMLAVGVIYRAIVLLASDRLAAALAALALAASPVFWSQAVVAEVYSLNAALVAAILYLMLRNILRPRPFPCSETARTAGGRSLPPLSNVVGSTGKGRGGDWYAIFFLFGLALSHHLTSVILLPPLILTLILARPRLSWKAWFLAAGLFLLGLTPWLFIFLRWPALHNGQGMTIGEWSGWIFGQRFGGALNLALWSDPTRWGIVTRIVVEQYGLIGLALAVIGFFVLVKQSWQIALITFITFVGYCFYGLVYNVPDVAVFMLPAFMVMAVWLGVAMAFAVERAGRWQDARGNTDHAVVRSLPVGRTTLYLLFALLPLWQLASHFGAINQHGLNADKEAWGRYVLSLPIPDRAALLVDSEKIAPLYYLQVTADLRPTLDIVVLGDEALYRQELDRRINTGQRVYLARFLPNLPYRLKSLGPLVEVSREPSSAAPAIGQAINASFGDQIELLGATAEPGNPYRITLYWKAISPQRQNYHVRLRLIDVVGRVWWEDTGAHPVGGYYPTGAWAQNEVVSDFHEVTLEPYLPPGTYDLEVGLFTPFRAEGLTVNGAEWLRAGQAQVIAPKAAPLEHDIRLAYGDTVVTSVDELGASPPESQVTLRLDAIGANALANFALINNRNIHAVFTETIRAGQTRVTFPAPEFEGNYQVWAATGQPARCHWLADLANGCELGTLTVSGEAAGDAINFENQVLLTEAKLDRDTVRPGESLKVNLTWRGLKPWPDNYTAFVHLLGPDGKVYGQVDQWPVQGTLPTSSWTAGQVVDDPYMVNLPPNAPSGKYQVEIGWYLLSTLRRLNVLDAAGRPSDDHVIVGEFAVP